MTQKFSYRYAPYPMAPGPPMQAVPQLATATPQQQQTQNPQMTAATANPYPGYNLTSVDMSSFNSIDWSSMYGMYV